MEKERLDKLISNITGISRSEIKKLSKKGLISLNGNTVSDCSVKTDAETDTVCVNNEKIELKKYVYIMLNKPKGVISASEGRDAVTVVDILPNELRRNGLFPAGRLDKDTTGFVLITNDGDFAHRILSPKNHVEKTYTATLDKPISDSSADELRNGITLKDGTVFKPAVIEPCPCNPIKVKVIICEGKYHQIKRMFKAVGCEVLELERIKIGGLSLDSSLKLGEARYITDGEIKQIVG